MTNRQQLEGKWKELSGRVKEKWGALTDDDLKRADGNVDKLVGVVQQKTGKAREEVQDFIDAIVNESGPVLDRVAGAAKQYASAAGDMAREYAGEAQEAVRRTYAGAEERVSSGYRDTEAMVRRNPVESVAIAFGAGLLSGVLVSLMLKDHR